MGVYVVDDEECCFGLAMAISPHLSNEATEHDYVMETPNQVSRLTFCVATNCAVPFCLTIRASGFIRSFGPCFLRSDQLKRMDKTTKEATIAEQKLHTPPPLCPVQT